MKQLAAISAILFAASLAAPLSAQNGCLTVLRAPVTGHWSQYDIRQPDGRTARNRFAIVGSERVKDSTLVWLESTATDEAGKTLMISKVLVPGFPYEGPSIRSASFLPSDGRVRTLNERQLATARNSAPRVVTDLGKGCQAVQRVGSDTVVVPAGRVAAEHYRNPSGTLHIWVSEQVPFGLVKYTNSGDRTEMVLRAHGADAKTAMPEPARQ